MSTENYVNDVMESMGWNNGSFIPVANIENRNLMELIQELTKEKTDKLLLKNNLETRVNNLNAHLTNAEQEINQNLVSSYSDRTLKLKSFIHRFYFVLQNLLDVHRGQVESEHNFFKITENEKSKFTKLIAELEKSQLELNRYQERTQNEVTRISAHLNSLAEKIQWAKTALNEFRLAMDMGQEANQLIEKYCKMDRSKAEVMEAKRRILQTNISKQRTILVNYYEEQKSLEQVLDRTAQLYRQAHIERRQMVSTWKEAVNQMNQREKDINDSERELEQAKEYSLIKTNELKEQIDFLDQQIQNNKDTEFTIAELNVETSKLRSKLTDLVEMVALYNNELATTKKTVYNVSMRLNRQRQKNRQELTEIKDKEVLLEKEKQNYEQLMKREEIFKSRNLSAQDRLRQLDEMMEIEEKNIKALQMEITRLSGALYRSNQQLNEFQSEEKILSVI